MTPHVPGDILNLDFGHTDLLGGALEICTAKGEIAFGIFTQLTGGNNRDTGGFDLTLQSGQYRHNKERYRSDPMSAMVYPVFDGFTQDRKVVGVLFTAMYWRFLMNEILPENIHGIICVMENSLGQTHTYEIRGQNTVYLGDEDLHDPKYDYMERSIDLVSYLRQSAGPESRSFTAAGVSGDFLNYTLRVYPTNEFREIFVTDEAAWESAGVAMVFVVAIFIFLVYDLCVQRRQRIVLERAVRATAVVSSLYPENIREHIINDDSNNLGKNASRGNAFLRSEVQESALVVQPLASKYSDCTVYFADIAGFTKWSSTRQPEQVFQLLETLFKEFDALATKRGVFKVETIGDCYMAVVSRMYLNQQHLDPTTAKSNALSLVAFFFTDGPAQSAA
jgi:Adenylate and Guanylate cyclase catalytic domain